MSTVFANLSEDLRWFCSDWKHEHFNYFTDDYLQIFELVLQNNIFGEFIFYISNFQLELQYIRQKHSKLWNYDHKENLTTGESSKYSRVCHVNSDNISPIVFEMTLSATLNVTTLWLGLRVFVGGVIGHMTLQFNSSMQLDRRWLCQRSIKRSK